MKAALRAVAAKAIEAILIDRDPEAGARRHLEAKLAVFERLFEDLLGQKQRPEQFGAPFEPGECREELRRCDSANAAFQHGATVEIDARSLGDRGHLDGGEQAARLRDLQCEHIGCGRLRKVECRFGTDQRFVGHDRHAGFAREPRQAPGVSERDRLLDQVDAGVAEQRQAL